MEANLILIEFFWFCLIIKVMYTYKNLNDIEINKVENGNLTPYVRVKYISCAC